MRLALLLVVVLCVACGPGTDGELVDAGAGADAATLDAGRDGGGGVPRRDAGPLDAGAPPDAHRPDAGRDGGCEVTPNAGCPAGEACYFVDVPGTMHERRCLPEGASSVDGPCDLLAGPNDCVAGSACEEYDGAGRCLQYCDFLTLCPSRVCNTRPAFFGEGYGYCRVE